MMEDYEKLLEEAYRKVSRVTESSSRFKIPQIISEIQGNRTLVKNFIEICNFLRRDPKHLYKYFLKELASPGSLEGNYLVLFSKIPSQTLQKRLELYIKEFVFCRVCKQPDTKIEKEGRISFIKCDACGARSSIRI